MPAAALAHAACRRSACPLPHPLQSLENAFTDWLPKLRSGVLVATAIDEPIQRYIAAQGGCDLKLVGEFAPFE